MSSCWRLNRRSMRDVAKQIAPAIQQRKPLVVSIAAGISECSLSAWLGADIAIVRCMPNTPALVLTGATALHANDNVGTEQRSMAENILRAVGIALWVKDEKELDAVTAVSGQRAGVLFPADGSDGTGGGGSGADRGNGASFGAANGIGRSKNCVGVERKSRTVAQTRDFAGRHHPACDRNLSARRFQRSGFKSAPCGARPFDRNVQSTGVQLMGFKLFYRSARFNHRGAVLALHPGGIDAFSAAMVRRRFL